MYGRCLFTLAVAGAIAGHCYAAPTILIGKDPRNTVPGTVAYGVFVDNQGLDWTVAAMKVDLISGSVHNHGSLDFNTPLDAIWPIIPEVEWDTWFGVPGDATNGIAGGAGDLGGGPLNIGGTGVDAISVSWFNVTTTNTGLTRIANVTFTDDAAGVLHLIAGGIGQFTQIDLTLAELAALPNLPPPLPEPGTLALLAGGVLWGISRARRVV